MKNYSDVIWSVANFSTTALCNVNKTLVTMLWMNDQIGIRKIADCSITVMSPQCYIYPNYNKLFAICKNVCVGWV